MGKSMLFLWYYKGLINIFSSHSNFLQPAPLINLSDINIFSSEFFWIAKKIIIKPGAAGWKVSMLPLCYVAPLYALYLMLQMMMLIYDGGGMGGLTSNDLPVGWVLYVEHKKE